MIASPKTFIYPETSGDRERGKKEREKKGGIYMFFILNFFGI